MNIDDRMAMRKLELKKTHEYLGFEDLYLLCESLSRSQGFYGRLLRDLQELDEEQIEEIDADMKAHKFTDDLDIIYWLEC